MLNITLKNCQIHFTHEQNYTSFQSFRIQYESHFYTYQIFYIQYFAITFLQKHNLDIRKIYLDKYKLKKQSLILVKPTTYLTKKSQI